MLARSVELTRSFGGIFGELTGEQRLGQLDTAEGKYGAARERLERALAICRASREPMVRAHATGRVTSTLALAEYRSGNIDAATRYLARGIATQRVVGDCAGCDVHLYPAAVVVYLALGDIAMAEEAARKADETAGAFRSEAWIATARFLLGLVARARGDQQMARMRMEEALTRFERIEQPYEVARASDALAHTLDDASRARELRARSQSLLSQLGAAPLTLP